MSSLYVRKGIKSDIPVILGFVKELAEYEKASHEVMNSIEQMEEDGFGENPIYRVHVAEDKESMEIKGIALFYTAYSTWKGRIIYLDDLIVKEDERKQGIGNMLMESIVQYAQQRKANQIRWHVLDWNEPAINFYNKINANLDEEWIQCKMSADLINNYKFTTI